ncbi:hypothetical protein QJS04_geneDACA022423 [Acorus gramineus]|uniref:Uncharacterized protein n=1 Tax=Acorus gramineus TaxID=55184 RepID=A0AAV9B840_ACOGR|nr:hypothetical protein QJS04_geneDACA022423 [Acorus gramineus]
MDIILDRSTYASFMLTNQTSKLVHDVFNVERCFLHVRCPDRHRVIEKKTTTTKYHSTTISLIQKSNQKIKYEIQDTLATPLVCSSMPPDGRRRIVQAVPVKLCRREDDLHRQRSGDLLIPCYDLETSTPFIFSRADAA